jgi:hypothetical protein
LHNTSIAIAALGLNLVDERLRHDLDPDPVQTWRRQSPLDGEPGSI